MARAAAAAPEPIRRPPTVAQTGGGRLAFSAPHGPFAGRPWWKNGGKLLTLRVKAFTTAMAWFEYPFFVNALIGVAIISVAAALVGTYIVTRRLVALSGGVTHACFGGLGLGCWLGWNPLAMAALFAVGGSLGVQWLSESRRVRSDSAIAVVWAVGMALGVLFVFLTPGYVPELNAFLFGSILNITRADLWLFAAYTAVLVAFFARRYREIVATAFDPDFARVAGLPVKMVTTVMTVLTALCIVLTIRLVGIMLLMSMISLPQLTAEGWSRRFGAIMCGAAGVSLGCCLAGLGLAMVVDVPCSALIVMIMAAVFAMSRAAGAVVRAVRRRGKGKGGVR